MSRTVTAARLVHTGTRSGPSMAGAQWLRPGGDHDVIGFQQLPAGLDLAGPGDAPGLWARRPCIGGGCPAAGEGFRVPVVVAHAGPISGGTA